MPASIILITSICGTSIIIIATDGTRFATILRITGLSGTSIFRIACYWGVFASTGRITRIEGTSITVRTFKVIVDTSPRVAVIFGTSVVIITVNRLSEAPLLGVTIISGTGVVVITNKRSISAS